MSETAEEYRARRQAEDAAREAKREKYEAHLDPAERTFRLAWYDYLYEGDHHKDAVYVQDLDRKLFVTVVPGAYGEPACAMVTIEGTPPHCMILVRTDDGDTRYWVIHDLPRGLSYERSKVISEDRPKKAQALRRAVISLVEPYVRAFKERQ